MYLEKLLLKKMYMVYNLTLIGHMAINVDGKFLLLSIFVGV